MLSALAKMEFMVYPFARQIRVFPGHLALVLISVVLFSLTFPQKVFARSEDQDMATLYRQRGVKAQEQGHDKEALFNYSRAVIFEPNNASLYNDQGLMQERLGQNEEAEQSYRKALELDPKYLPAYANLGVLYGKMKQYPLAVQYLEKRINMGSVSDPWTLRAQEELEKVYSASPQLKSERMLREAEEMNLRVAQGKERYQKIQEEKMADGFEASYSKGLEALEEKRFNDAVNYLENAVALNPHSAAAHHALKRARFDREMYLIDMEARKTQRTR